MDIQRSNPREIPLAIALGVIAAIAFVACSVPALIRLIFVRIPS